jgi:hypothetical protein
MCGCLVVIEEIDTRLSEQQQQEVMKILRDCVADRGIGQDGGILGGVMETTSGSPWGDRLCLARTCADSPS